jgi:hypothetical protein
MNLCIYSYTGEDEYHFCVEQQSKSSLIFFLMRRDDGGERSMFKTIHLTGKFQGETRGVRRAKAGKGDGIKRFPNSKQTYNSEDHYFDPLNPLSINYFIVLF